MERQKPTTNVKHNDAFSEALMDSYTRWMGGEGFQGSQIQDSLSHQKGALIAISQSDTKKSADLAGRRVNQFA